MKDSLRSQRKIVLTLKALSLIALTVVTTTAQGKLPPNEANRIADAIYRIEGGNNTRYPYGIKSVKTSDPRRVCINTIQNNHDRWLNEGKPGLYLNYLADKYCPYSVDRVGNANWKKNIKALIK